MSLKILFAAALALAGSAANALAFDAAGHAVQQAQAPSPPWQHGQNNDASDRGFEFTVPDADNLADFHGSPDHPALVLYVGGNYFFAMALLVKAFEARYPQYQGRLYWETIPPGLLVDQMKAGGTVTVGNMTWTVKPDVYLAGLSSVQKQIDAGLLQAPAVPYVTNDMTIMIAKGNPKHITGLSDLARPDVTLAMPNPEFEGISRQIKASLEKAGGEQLETTIYETKVKQGTTELTHIHHRQTPLWIMQGRVDAGVTWQSEAIFQEQAGHSIGHVAIPDSQNTTAIYAAAIVKNTAHAEAARRWLDFIRSGQSLAIFERFGFKRYTSTSP
jgi:ABC-type molybdate transport system substrate-binding protein